MLKSPSPAGIKAVLLVLFVMALVCLPFAIFGEDFILPLLKSREQQAGALLVLSVCLLAADSVAPVPATLVIMHLAAQAGWLTGMVGGTLGLCAGVGAAAWIGRAAVGRIVPRFLPDHEVARLRHALQRRLWLTLACLRSVPVLAETSVIVASAMGVPVKRIFHATLLPNLVVSTIYSVAADDSFGTAVLTFAATMGLSYAAWRLFARGEPPPGVEN